MTKIKAVLMLHFIYGTKAAQTLGLFSWAPASAQSFGVRPWSSWRRRSPPASSSELRSQGLQEKTAAWMGVLPSLQRLVDISITREIVCYFSYSHNLHGWLWEGLALLIWVCSILQKFLCYTDKAKERRAIEWSLSKVVHAVNSHTYGRWHTKSINVTRTIKLKIIWNAPEMYLNLFWGLSPLLLLFSQLCICVGGLVTLQFSQCPGALGRALAEQLSWCWCPIDQVKFPEVSSSSPVNQNLGLNY